MKAKLFIIFICVSAIVNAQVTFLKSYGPSFGLGFATTNEVVVKETFDGNYIVAGTLSANGGDFFLMKLNLQGDTIWTKCYGGIFEDVLLSAIQTADSGFLLAGATRSFSMGDYDAYVLKTNKYGIIQWTKNYGGINLDLFATVKQTNDGGYITCGTTFTVGAGIADVYLIKMDVSGNIQWSKAYGGSGYERGSYIEQTFDNGYIVTGFTNSFTGMAGRIYLVKIDSVGNPQWNKIFGGNMGEDAYCVKQCTDSSFIVTGYTNSFSAGGGDVFLLKTSVNGNLSWMKTYSSNTDAEEGYYVEQTSDHGFIVAGRTQGFGSGGGDYIIKTNINGVVSWSKVYPCSNNNGHYIHQTNDGGYIHISNPGVLRIIKMDSTGSAGCNEINASPIVSLVTPVVTTGINTSSGGNAANSATATRYFAITIDTICGVVTSTDNIKIEDKIVVYPNPTSNSINFIADASNKNKLVQIINNLGKEIYTASIPPLAKEEILTLTTQKMLKGIYFLRIYDGIKSRSQKFVVD